MSDYPKNLNELIEKINKNSPYKFQLRVNANSKVNSIEFFDNYIKIKINQKPIEGRANKAIIEYLAKYLNIPKSKIQILSGQNTSIKTIKIEK